MSALPIPVTDAEFEQEVLGSELPVLVDFWADWCGPCKMVSPLLDQLAQEYAGRLKVCKVNVDDSPATPARYGIRGIPTLMLFQDGQVSATQVGALGKAQLVKFVDAQL